MRSASVMLEFPASTDGRTTLSRDIGQGISLSRNQQMLTPTDVARALNAAGLKYVIVGAHAANGYTGKPRATVDVDLVAQFPGKARDTLMAAFADLTAEEHPVVIRLKRDGKEAIDIIRPTSGLLFKASLKRTQTVIVDLVEIPVPPLETMLAMKFSSMMTITRKLADRKQDAVDFMRMVDANRLIDQARLLEMGELAYPGAGDQVVGFVADVRAGRDLLI